MKDTFLEDLFWTSYRYCIGRHSYVSSLAKDMADYFYEKIGDNRKQFIAEDIRRTISDCLKFNPFNISFDWSVKTNERKPMELVLCFINSISSEFDGNDNREELIHDKLRKIDSVSFYKDKNCELQQEITFIENPRFEKTIYEHELLDLIPWMDLASLFDVNNHRIAVVIDKDTNEETEYEVYESYINDSIITERKNNYCVLKNIPWKYKKIYRLVTDGISNRYLDDSTIAYFKDEKKEES